uniref:Uncharacterized protein n=1 Tax=Bracon brevicornis TaxID=1563983 RepID=A0A6V7JLS5_9HYME
MAMGAVVYIRQASPTNISERAATKITLVCAKTKVAPLKKLTIPRLELNAALILSELVKYVPRTLELDNVETHLWTNSMIALTWINGRPSRWKDYQQNKVIKIKDNLPTARWRHIAGKGNPADCASRGLSPSQLVNHQLWWQGPPWLNSSSEHWPINDIKQQELP